MSATYENDVPSDDSYVSRPGHKDEAVKVVSDDEPLETSGNAKNLDSDEQLGMHYLQHTAPLSIHPKYL